jgi:hypothetical protein
MMVKNTKKYVAPKPVDSFPIPFALGLKAFTVTGFTILAVQLLRGAAQSEGPDKAIYLLAIITAGIFLLLGLTKGNFATGKYFYGPSALIIAALGILGVEQHDPINGVVLSNRLWLGFGPFVLILALFISGFIFKIIEWKSLGGIWRVLLGLIFTTNLILVIPSFWQSSKTVIDADHSEYVINEMIAPLTGHWPYSNFIPQYQSFYGFFLNPFASSMNAAQISNLALVGLTFLSYLTMALGVFVAWQSLDKRSWILAIGLVIPFTALTQFPNREGYLGSIAALLSGLSIRVFPGLLLLFALIQTLKKFRNSFTRSRFVWLFLVGSLAGIVSWQSQDFGIAAAITAFLVIALAGSTQLIDFKSTVAFCLGFIPGFSAYPVVASISGHSLDFSYFLFFARQFGSGFGAERMRTLGPVVIVLPLIVLLVVTHGIYLYKSKVENSDGRDKYLNSLIGFSFSVWSFAGFTYYLNRSYASGQMQVLFLSIAISLASLIGIALKSPELELPKGYLFSKKAIQSKSFYWVLPMALIFSLPIATLILSPNPKVEMARIDEGSVTPRWPKATVLASVSDAKVAAVYAKTNNLKIGFFGASAAYVEKETGVQSLSILNSPFDLAMSQQTIKVSCDFLSKINPDVIVASDEGAALFQFEGKTLCNTYIQRDIPGVRSGHFAVRVGQ